MEQQIFGSIGDERGYRTIAKTQGLSEDVQVELEGLYDVFGGASSQLPQHGAFNFIEFRSGFFAAWKLFLVRSSERGIRDTLWAHAILFNQRELSAMNADPFVLEDAGLFRTPQAGLAAQLEQIKPPQPKKCPIDLDPLLALSEVERELFIAAAFCRGRSCIGSNVICAEHIRSLFALVPLKMRPQLTFYGCVTGAPPIKAKLLVVPTDSFRMNLDPEASVITSLEAAEYRGEDPTAYAATLTGYLNQRNMEAVINFVRFTGNLNADVFQSSTKSLVTLFEKSQKYVDGLAVQDLLESCDALAAGSDRQAITAYRNDCLLQMATRIATSGATDDRIVAVIGALVDSVISSSSIEDPRFRDVIRTAWKKARFIPGLIPILLRADAACDCTSQAVEQLSSGNFDKYLHAVRVSITDVEQRALLWRSVIEVAQSVPEYGVICEQASKALLLELLREPSDVHLQTQWDHLKKYIIRSNESIQLIAEALRSCPFTRDRRPLISDLVIQATRRRTMEDLAEWILWAWRNPQEIEIVLRHFPDDLSLGEIERFTGHLRHRAQMTWGEVVQTVMTMATQSRSLRSLPVRVVRSLPILERVRLVSHCYAQTPRMAKSICLLDAVAPQDDSEAKQLIRVFEHGFSVLPKLMRKQLVSCLIEWSHQYPSLALLVYRCRPLKRQPTVGTLAAIALTAFAVTVIVVTGLLLVVRRPQTTGEQLSPSSLSENADSTGNTGLGRPTTSDDWQDLVAADFDDWQDLVAAEPNPSSDIIRVAGLSSLHSWQQILCEAAIFKSPKDVGRQVNEAVRFASSQGGSSQLWVEHCIDLLDPDRETVLFLDGERLRDARQSYIESDNRLNANVSSESYERSDQVKEDLRLHHRHILDTTWREEGRTPRRLIDDSNTPLHELWQSWEGSGDDRRHSVSEPRKDLENINLTWLAEVIAWARDCDEEDPSSATIGGSAGNPIGASKGDSAGPADSSNDTAIDGPPGE